MTDLLQALVAITTVVDGILAGAVLDYVIKQLPARGQIGIKAYKEYFLASDLGYGRFWYIPLGLSAYALNVGVLLVAYSQKAGGFLLSDFAIAAACSLLHAFGTSQAVPAGMAFTRTKTDDDSVLRHAFDRFARWVVFRGIIGVPLFVAMLMGLMVVS